MKLWWIPVVFIFPLFPQGIALAQTPALVTPVVTTQAERPEKTAEASEKTADKKTKAERREAHRRLHIVQRHRIK